MTNPTGSVTHNSLPRHQSRIDLPAHVAVSELERLQLSYNFSRWNRLFFAALAVGFALGAPSLDDWLCAMMVATTAFIATFIWARGWVLGMPILPIFSLASLVYYGFPFVTGHPVVSEYDAAEKLAAAGTVSISLFVTTLVWALIGRPASRQVRIVRQIEPGIANRILLYCLAGACLYQMNALFWFINVPSEAWGVMRAVLHTLGLVAAFALANQLGAGLLERTATYLFGAMLMLFIALNTLTFYLYTAIEIGIIALLGYFLGGGRPPWKVIALACVVFAILHAGKGEMRVRYWDDGADAAAEAVSSGARLVQWFEFGVENLIRPPEANEDSSTLVQRASLIQMILKARTETPDEVPFLGGTTYLPIPFLLVPRIVWPDRPNAQETLIQLNVHYGLLTRESSELTSIGWGMIAEAYANFGMAGCLGLGLLLGIMLGVTQRVCGRYPVLSARGLSGLIILTAMLRIEAPMALFLSSLLQSFFPLALLTWIVMRPSPAAA